MSESPDSRRRLKRTSSELVSSSNHGVSDSPTSSPIDYNLDSLAPRSQAQAAHELAFGLLPMINRLKGRISTLPLFPHQVPEYATYLGNQQPYSNKRAKISAERSPVTAHEPVLTDPEDRARFPSIFEFVPNYAPETSSLTNTVSEFNSGIDKLVKEQGFYESGKAMYRSILAADKEWPFSEAEDYDGLKSRAKQAQKQGCSLLYSGNPPIEGLLQLLESVILESKALEAFRLKESSYSEIYNLFKLFSLRLSNLKVQIEPYNPPSCILALIELFLSSVSFRLSSISELIVPMNAAFEDLSNEIGQITRTAITSWKHFSKLLPRAGLHESFPETWKSITESQELEDGEDSPLLTYPIPSDVAPCLPAVVFFAISIMKEFKA
ncbi:hypothetical protein DSO57_1005803 [Entomophthora muscae]|uniref:Uncharacterized protein n=1 Tax=Entomophthora muscae TaxID=34485 RepID=A0ACC2TIH9_9FUNG|nr:hypothetical protein DSO57_1005803 [Entomophthora muscae]